MDVAITGIGAASVSFTEYYSLKVLRQYTDLIIPLKEIFIKNPASLTASDYDTILNQVTALKTLAKEGVEEWTGEQNIRNFLNEEMAVRLNDIMRTLAFVGIPPNPNTPSLSAEDKLNTVLAWQSLPNFQIDVLGALNQALKMISNAQTYVIQIKNPGTGKISDLQVAASPEHTLQSMLELEYIKTGNTQVASKLGFLEGALSLSQQIMITLTGMQNLANQIQVTNSEPFSLPSSSLSLNDFKAAYKQSASAYFAQVFPSPIPVSNAAQQLLDLKQKLYSQLTQLEQISPLNKRSTPGTLAFTLFAVIKDISTIFSGISTQNNPQLQNQLFAAVKKWIMDNQDKRLDDPTSNTAGAIQDRLTTAIKTAENLEESQREDVRRYLFVFQEFYKSAAAMIQLLGEMFAKINRGITRS